MLVYDPVIEEPWAAFDVGWYESGRVTCGERVLLIFESTAIIVRAWDAGRFQGRWVTDYGPDVPIVVDLPEHLRPDSRLSWPVVVVTMP